jgi:hypothetical protein
MWAQIGMLFNIISLSTSKEFKQFFIHSKARGGMKGYKIKKTMYLDKFSLHNDILFFGGMELLGML